jgi:hypothetical protein
MHSFTSHVHLCDPTYNRRIAVQYKKISSDIQGFSITTQRILVILQIRKLEVKERIKQYNLATDFVMI